MSGESFELDRLDAFVPGAVGEPGARVFYLQGRVEGEVVTLRCEKQQVGMLGRYLTQLAQAMGPVEPDRDVVGLVEPIEAAWTVGQLSVGVDEAEGLIVVSAEEMTAEAFEVEAGDDLTAEEVDALVEAASEMMDDPAMARFSLTPGQALAFGERAEELMATGRPPCPLCGAAMDPTGHDCPRWN